MILASPSLNRRRFLTGTAAIGTAAALGLPARAQSPLTVGFIYVGPKDDFGYNQAHAEGAAAVKAMPGVTVVEEENVPETVDVQKTMESMINLDGATLIFPTSFGYFDPHMLELAPKYPGRAVPPRGGLWTKEGPDEHRVLFRLYRHGPVSERHRRRPHASSTKKIGFVAAKPIPQVLHQHQLVPARRARRSTRRSPARSSSPANGRWR